MAESKAAAAPKRGGIDYSKFDDIEDSDDEKPKQETATAKATPEKPHCHNCHKDITKALRCSVCKKVSYCSAQCLRDDWPFHKRTCQKPEPKAKPKHDGGNVPSDSKAKPKHDEGKAQSNSKAKPAEEDTVEENDENLSWYRHREWRPEEGKKEFKPTQVSPETVAQSTEADVAPRAGSAWNKAGTWEDKDVTVEARKTLMEKLNEPMFTLDVAGGSLSMEGVDSVEGEASKPAIRGRVRHMFDFSFKAKLAFKWMQSGGQQRISGHLEVNDFTNDTFASGADDAPGLRVSFQDTGKLDASRRRAVEAACCGADGTWPPAQGTLLHEIASRMESWAKAYQEMS